VKFVFHATKQSAGEKILDDGTLHSGQSGLFGGAIYFAESVEIARHKCRDDRRSCDMVVGAFVDFGVALVMEGSDRTMTETRLRELGCDSIKGRSSPSAGWEFVVFDSKRIFTVLRPENGDWNAIHYSTESSENGRTKCEVEIDAGTPFDFNGPIGVRHAVVK
jgi:hypothetical protein